MTSFGVKGKLAGHDVQATVTDGKLEGDDALVASIKGLVAGEARVSLPGIVAGTASLDDPMLGRATLAAACDEDQPVQLIGDRPPLRAVPDDADA